MSSKILTVIEKPGTTKLQSLIDAVREAVASGFYRAGDQLPSVNELSDSTGFSRDTVVKAYQALVRQSMVESVPGKGYFVSSRSQKVFMLLDDFSAFKEQLYRSFRKNLPQRYSVDLLFHHYNARVFEQLIRHAAGRYNSYLIMNLDNRKLHPVLSHLPPSRLLLLDMGCEQDSRNNYLLQNFSKATYACLVEGLPELKKYSELVFVYSRQKTPHPYETRGAVRDFCQAHGLNFKETHEFTFDSMRKGQVYLVFAESDLVQVLKGCRDNGLSLGSDVGIIAYNDTPMKEIAGNGITVISVDFYEMGQKAAQFVRQKGVMREVLSTRLIVRNSL